jgi:hypothetical protein
LSHFKFLMKNGSTKCNLTNKSDSDNITAILLKVALNTINQPQMKTQSPRFMRSNPWVNKHDQQYDKPWYRLKWDSCFCFPFVFLYHDCPFAWKSLLSLVLYVHFIKLQFFAKLWKFVLKDMWIYVLKIHTNGSYITTKDKCSTKL